MARSLGVEVEVKSSVEDIRKLKKRLSEMGARKVDDAVENDVYYNHPARDFARTDEALRIRTCAGRSSLTYKGPKLDFRSKSREELIIGLDSAPDAAAMLERLGFRKVAEVRKRRRKYALGQFEICLDRVAGLGAFIEIEAQAPRKGYEKVLDRALSLLVRLGGKKQERRSYLELLLSRKGLK